MGKGGDLLKTGKLPPEILSSSVYPYLGEQRKEVLVHSGFGEDCSVIDFGENVAVLSTDPITGADKNSSYLSVFISCNDIAACGAKPLGVLTTLLLPPGTKNCEIQAMMKEIHNAARKIGVEVLGGHSEITYTVTKPVISSTAVGIAKKNEYVTSQGAKPGDKVIVTKALGLEGTSIMANDFGDFLEDKISKKIIDSAKEFIKNISVIDESIIATKAGVSAMHDITEGGVLGACYEIAAASDVGIKIYKEKLPILPETKAICDVFDINPLGLISSGSMLICTPYPDKVINNLNGTGITATIVGDIIKEGKFIKTGDKEYPLIPPKRDELYKAVEYFKELDQ